VATARAAPAGSRLPDVRAASVRIVRGDPARVSPTLAEFEQRVRALVAAR